MSQMMDNLQGRIKNSSAGTVVFLFRLMTGIFFGLCLALIADEIFEYGTFSFSLVITIFTGVFIRISRGWRLFGVVVFNLVLVLIGLLLRMYILVAPGA